jgi:hypothetical protein
MERVKELWEQAKMLRAIAARSRDYPAIYEQALALAQQCDELADSLSEDLSTADASARPKTKLTTAH